MLALARRPALEHTISFRGAFRTTAWAFASWLAIGLQTLVLVERVGDLEWSVRLVVLSVTAFALAWCVGFVTFISPAGAGAREAALVLMLSGVLSPGRALLVAVLSRVLMTAADLGPGRARHRPGAPAAPGAGPRATRRRPAARRRGRTRGEAAGRTRPP